MYKYVAKDDTTLIFSLIYRHFNIWPFSHTHTENIDVYVHTIGAKFLSSNDAVGHSHKLTDGITG